MNGRGRLRAADSVSSAMTRPRGGAVSLVSQKSRVDDNMLDRSKFDGSY